MSSPAICVVTPFTVTDRPFICVTGAASPEPRHPRSHPSRRWEFHRAQLCSRTEAPGQAGLPFEQLSWMSWYVVRRKSWRCGASHRLSLEFAARTFGRVLSDRSRTCGRRGPSASADSMRINLSPSDSKRPDSSSMRLLTVCCTSADVCSMPLETSVTIPRNSSIWPIVATSQPVGA